MRNGQKHSLKTKEKLKLSHLGKIGYWKNKKRYFKNPKERNKKISQSLIGNTRTLGKKIVNRKKVPPKSIGTRKKIGLSAKNLWKQDWYRKRMTGKNSPNWQNGKSFEPYAVDWNDTLKRSIRERDHYICRLCSGEGYPVHHIDYNKKNCHPDNLITLCIRCNSKVNFNRDYWMNYFKNL